MGLIITGCCTEFNYSKGYGGMHRIRALGILTQTYTEKVSIDENWAAALEIEKEKDNWNKFPEFWQLLHFSDCEGYLLQEGFFKNIDYSKSFFLGNSERLLQCLELVRIEVTKNTKLYNQFPRPLQDFWDLYNLVHDEVQNGCGSLHFH